MWLMSRSIGFSDRLVNEKVISWPDCIACSPCVTAHPRCSQGVAWVGIRTVDGVWRRWFQVGMTPPPDLSRLTEAEKDALILALWARGAELEARLSGPPKTPGNSSLPPSKGHKAIRPDGVRRAGPRRGSLGRAGGGRPLAEEPDQFVIAKAAACAPCRAALDDAAQVLPARYDKVELPPIRPVVTRVERYLGRCPCCGGATLAPVPEGMDEGSPFGVSILALALYLRFTHAISYRRLTRLFLHLFALPISEGALDAMFRRAKPRFDDEAAAILARLRSFALNILRAGGVGNVSEAVYVNALSLDRLLAYGLPRSQN